jgi:hypothetical protein
LTIQVVELEISLDETREQYNNVLRTSNNRAQQKKMMFLERNLEQLTVVQRQLVEQNSSLKKEVAIAERKLIARNERIQSLESLLQDSQEKLTAANHRYVQSLEIWKNILTNTTGSKRSSRPSKSVSRPRNPDLPAVWDRRRPMLLLHLVVPSAHALRSRFAEEADLYKMGRSCLCSPTSKHKRPEVPLAASAQAGSSTSGSLSTGFGRTVYH